MKKILNWVLTATLVCGANVFTACTTDSSDNPTQEQAKKNRTEFIKHTRENLKNIAENLNFTSWEIANRINQEFNTAILTNPEFEKTISNLFVQKIKESVKPVEEGSELAEMGYKQYATVDLTKFNYRFTMKEDGSGFDVEEADDFEMIINGFDPQTLETKVGGRKLTLKAGGDTFKQLVKRLSTKETAVVSLVPSEFTFTIAGKVNDTWHDGLIGVFNNKANMSGKSELMNLNNDAFNVSGILTTIVGEMPGAHSADATELAFTFSNDPEANETGMSFSFVHNNKNIIELDATGKYTEKEFDLSQFFTSGSIIDVLVAQVVDTKLESTLTLNDDLTTTVSINDCGKLLKVQREMANARRHYADQATIEGYTQQLNELLDLKLTCKDLSQEIPMKLQTTKLGIDYFAMPSFNFADEKGFVPLTDLLDKESLEYGFNIIDHAAQPMAGSIITARQLLQFMQTFIMQMRVSQAQSEGAN